MFTKEQINNWIELFSLSDNSTSINKYTDLNESRPFLKRDLVEAKMMVDRWNNVTTAWIFHTSKKDVIMNLFPEDETIISDDVKSALKVLMKYASVLESGINLKDKSIENLSDDDLNKIVKDTNTKKEYHIWGADVHFSDNIDPNKAIGLALHPDGLTLMPNDSNNITNSIIVFDMP